MIQLLLVRDGILWRKPRCFGHRLSRLSNQPFINTKSNYMYSTCLVCNHDIDQGTSLSHSYNLDYHYRYVFNRKEILVMPSQNSFQGRLTPFVKDCRKFYSSLSPSLEASHSNDSISAMLSKDHSKFKILHERRLKYIKQLESTLLEKMKKYFGAMDENQVISTNIIKESEPLDIVTKLLQNANGSSLTKNQHDSELIYAIYTVNAKLVKALACMDHFRMRRQYKGPNFGNEVLQLAQSYSNSVVGDIPLEPKYYRTRSPSLRRRLKRKVEHNYCLITNSSPEEMAELAFFASEWLKVLEKFQDYVLTGQEQTVDVKERLSVWDKIKSIFFEKSQHEQINLIDRDLLSDLYIHVMKCLLRTYIIDLDVKQDSDSTLKDMSSQLHNHSNKNNETYEIDLAEINQLIVDECEDVVQRMELLKEQTISTSSQLEIYHMLLRVYAQSENASNLLKAEKLLNKLCANVEENHEKNKEINLFLPRPNAITFQIVMRAYARLRGTLKAATGCERLIRQMELFASKTNDPTFWPDVESHNILLRAYMASSFKRNIRQYDRKALANKALDVLEQLERMDVANFNSYSMCVNLLTFSDEEDHVKNASLIIERMEGLYRLGKINMLPNTMCFNQLIRSRVKKVKTVDDMIKLEQLMDKMIGLKHENSMPDSVTFRLLFEGWQKVGNNQAKGTKAAGEYAERLLAKMESQYAGGNNFVQPDRRAYLNVIKCWASSPSSTEALERVYSIISRMKHLSQLGKSELSPRKYMYHEVMKMCITYNVKIESDKARAMQIAFDCYNDMLKNGIFPSSETYNLLLKCITINVPGSNERDAVVSQIFQTACDQGQASSALLTTLEKASPRMRMEYIALPEHSSRVHRRSRK